MNAKKILSMVMSAAMLLTVSVGVNAEEKEPEVKITQTDISAETVSNYSKYAKVSEVYYDSTGKKVLDCSEYNSSKLYDGVIVVEKSLDEGVKAYEYLGLDGKVIHELSWDSIFAEAAPDDTEAENNYYKWADSFFDGYAVVRPYGNDNYYSYDRGTHIIDKSGKICYALTDKEISDGCYIKNIGSGQFVCYNGTTKIIDYNGKTVKELSNTFSAVDTFNGIAYNKCYLKDISVEYSGLRTAMFGEIPQPEDQGDGDCFLAYLDSDFNVLPIRVMNGWAWYHEIKPFYDDYAVTKSDMHDSWQYDYGYMDKQGNMIIPEEYDAAYGYGNGLFSVGMDGKFGFVDKDNKAVVPLEYDDITQFVDGVAYGVKDGKLVVFEVPTSPIGDANGDNTLNVRDAAHIAKMLAQGKADELPESADFNGDGKINVRDAAAIAKFLATGKK